MSARGGVYFIPIMIDIITPANKTGERVHVDQEDEERSYL